MAAVQNIDVFTQAVNAAFVNAYEFPSEAAPIDDAITEVGSKGKIENYPWLYPPPLMHLWKGYRQAAKLGQTNYKVPNLTYTCEFSIQNEDLDDDQIGGFKLQGAAMAKAAKDWKGIQCLLTLALGQTTPCFDGSNFFASSHTIGTGNNIVTGTAASNDGITHAMAVLVLRNKLVRPLLWQMREPPNFDTDMGTPGSLKSRESMFWSDLRGAAAFGFWYDCILCKWANTPTVAEVQTTLGVISSTFRTFTYPKNLATDVNQYIHGQTKFDQKNVMIICSTKLEQIVRQVLTLSLLASSENYWKDWARLECSGYLDTVVSSRRAGANDYQAALPDTGSAAFFFEVRIMPNELGECLKCHAGLMVTGRQVVCQECGTYQPDHPVNVENESRDADAAAAAFARKPLPGIPEIKPHKNWNAQSQTEIIKDLQKRVERLEKIVAGGTGKRAG